MRELDKELKELRLYGMAGAWEDLVKQGSHATLERSRWLLKANCSRPRGGWSSGCGRACTSSTAAASPLQRARSIGQAMPSCERSLPPVP